ncbi:hypothetical protein WJX77_012469 [Trebouxia sp. C0004]
MQARRIGGLCILAASCIIGAATLDDDHVCLGSLKDAISSDPTGVLDGWTGSPCSPPLTYSGVQCSLEQKETSGEIASVVSGIHLADQDLVGTLPPDLTRCFHLTTLNISHNDFYGAIPPGYARIDVM